MNEAMLDEIEDNYCTTHTRVEPVFTAAAMRIMELPQPTTFEQSLELYHTLVTLKQVSTVLYKKHDEI